MLQKIYRPINQENVTFHDKFYHFLLHSPLVKLINDSCKMLIVGLKFVENKIHMSVVPVIMLLNKYSVIKTIDLHAARDHGIS